MGLSPRIVFILSLCGSNTSRELFLRIVREAMLLDWQKNNIRLFIRSVLNS
uniref:Uncharacterized protein n=1 Tax=Physcomitrium patens TaxID=3218 RepID=A0A2K1JQH9_PHYPA|nr:hypothetical protein PHYPA_016174 [Physcomitrium patens]